MITTGEGSMELGDVFANDNRTFQFVKAVDGHGAFAYWKNPHRYEVTMGEFDIKRMDDIAGQAVIGVVNVIAYPELPWWSNLLFGRVKRWYLEREYPVCGPRYIIIQHKVAIVMRTKEVADAPALAEIRSNRPESSH